MLQAQVSIKDAPKEQHLHLRQQPNQTRSSEATGDENERSLKHILLQRLRTAVSRPPSWRRSSTSHHALGQML